jgi:hypothetical protein
MSAAAVPADSKPAARPVISDWISINRNSLVGAFTVTLPSGMIINGCMLHRSPNGGSEWIGIPGAVQLEKDGTVKRAGDGKPVYRTIVRFKSRDVYERFQTPILEELRRLGHL